MRIATLLSDDALEALVAEPVNGALLEVLELATLRACAGMHFPSHLEEDPESTPLRSFIARLLFYSQIPFNVMLAVTVYLARLGRALPSAKGAATTPHRMFFGCLVLTAKYLHDVPPANANWVLWLLLSCNNMYFTTEDLMHLEIEILQRCGWRADIHEHDFLREYQPFEACLDRALQLTRLDYSCQDSQSLCSFTDQRLQKIQSFVGQIRHLYVTYPCLLCTKQIEGQYRRENDYDVSATDDLTITLSGYDGESFVCD